MTDMTMEKDFQKQVQEHKVVAVGTAFSLACHKLYGCNYRDKVSTSEITQCVKHIQEKHPVLFEALYDLYWNKLNEFLNEDKTVTALGENWEELL